MGAVCEEKRPHPRGQERWSVMKPVAEVKGKQDWVGAAKDAVKSEQECNRCGLVWSEDWNNKGNGVEEGLYLDV